jgi:hypothetical protein
LSIKVEFGFAESGVAVNFNDISRDVISVSINRGKDPQQDTFNAASCSIQLNNETRNYDPDYGPSPYQGLIVPTGEVRVYKDNQIIFTGYITDWNFSYSPTGESIAEIVAADAFWNLNNQTLTDYSPTEQLSSARILAVLLRPEVGGTAIWPTSQRLISPGVATMGDYPVSDGTNALSYLQEVEKAEPGRLFIDKSGRIVFRSRNNDLLNPDYEYTRINLSSNPSFENNLDSWFYTIGGLTRSTATAYIGTASGLVAAGGGAEHYFSSDIGATYTVSLYAKASAGTVTVDFAGLTSTNGNTYQEINKTTGTVTSSEWTRVHTTFDAVSVYSGLRILQLPSSNSVYIDNILVEETPVLDAYFDGDNAPVYNTSDPEAPDYQPNRIYESYDPEWVLGS